MDRNFGDGSGGPPRQIVDQQQQQYPQRYKFSPEEMRVLRECNRESFWFRSLPLGTALGSLVYMGVKSGKLSASPKWGAVPKVVAAASLGYFIGKFSYQAKCMEKLMNLPDSQLAEYLKRQKGRLGIQESLTLEPEFYTATGPSDSASTAPLSGPGSESYSDLRSDMIDTLPLNALENESSAHYSSIDIGRPVDATEQMLNDENLPPPRQQYNLTYDDLRRQNRVDYETGRYRSQPAQQAERRPAQPPPPPTGSNSPGIAKKKNQYGDVWEDAE